LRKVQAKGINFRSFVSSLRALRGNEAVSRTFDLLPPELGEPLRVGAITTGGWYPTQWYADLHAAAQRATGEGVELARAVARHGVHEDFKSGAYRLITISIAPQVLLKLAQKVMALYWDGGHVVIEQAENGRAVGRFDGYGGFNRSIWEDVIGGSLGVLEVGGAKNLTARVVAGGGDGDGHMVYVVRWDAG
jgi:hypothetical protein